MILIMDKYHSMGLYLVPLLLTHVILDLTSLETWSEYVKKMETGLEMNQLVKVSYKLHYYTIIITHFVFMIVHTVIITDCGELDDPNNGQVSLNGTTLGSIATYTCDTGFDLIGDMERICQANGNWSGNEPTCEGTIIK